MPSTLDAYRSPDRLLARIRLHERFANNSFDLHRWLLDELLEPQVGGAPLVPAVASVLEVGAGTGRLWEVGRDRVPSGWSLTLTDRSEGMLGALFRLVSESGLAATVRQADATHLPFPDGAFDVAIANHMLYHVPEPAKAIAELQRVLRPGGLLVAATNGSGHLHQVVALARELQGLAGVTLMGVEPLSFTCESGEALLGASFARVELRRQNDQLVITDAAALLDYLRSLVHVAAEAPVSTVEALRAWEERVLAVPLPFVVDRATGVFLAWP